MGQWILGKIRYLFWSMMASSALMVIMSFNPSYKQKMMQLVHVMKAQSQRMKGEAPASMRTQDMSDAVPVESANNLPVAAEQDRQVSSSANEYVVDDASYVLIEGKYYKARADNTYYINGQKVFYVNNRRTGGPVGGARVAGAAGGEATADREAASQATYSDLPTTPTEVLEQFKKVNENMQKRDEYLKEIEKE